MHNLDYKSPNPAWRTDAVLNIVKHCYTLLNIVWWYLVC